MYLNYQSKNGSELTEYLMVLFIVAFVLLLLSSMALCCAEYFRRNHFQVEGYEYEEEDLDDGHSVLATGSVSDLSKQQNSSKTYRTYEIPLNTIGPSTLRSTRSTSIGKASLIVTRFAKRFASPKRRIQKF